MRICSTESEVVLCDFHREKARWEWTSKASNGVLGIRKEVLLQMRWIAKVPTMELMEEAIRDFKGSFLWTDNP